MISEKVAINPIHVIISNNAKRDHIKFLEYLRFYKETLNYSLSEAYQSFNRNLIIMNNLVFKGNNDQALTSSLLVAEKFGKRHVEVLDAVRELMAKMDFSTFVDNQKINGMFALIEQEITMPIGGGIKKATITKPGGDIIVTTTSKVTGKGQIYFVNKFIRKDK